MIDEILDIIKNEVDTFLKLKIRDNQHQYVYLAPVVDLNGKPSLNENAICMTLVKIEEERANMSNHQETKLIDDRVYSINSPVKLNLYLLFSAAYMDGQEKNYLEALKRLSYVIGFFQAKNVFNSQNTPKLDPGYGKISIDLINQPFEEQVHFWGMFGGLYRPSLLYRLRTLMVQEDQVAGISEPVREMKMEPSSTVTPKG